MPRIIAAILLCILLAAPAAPCAAASPPLVLRDGIASASLSGHIDILKDTTGRLTIEQASSPEMAGAFRPDPRPVPNFGMTNTVYWLRFTIRREAPVARELLLELDFPHMDYLDLYEPLPGGGFDRLQAGDMRPMSIRRFAHRNPVFPLAVDSRPMTLYLRADARGRALMPLTLWTTEAFYRMDSRRNMAHSAYFGAMLVMCIYNLFLFISLRDRNYLYYILDIFCLALYIFFSNGFLLEYVSADRPFINQYTPLLAVPAVLSGLMFCRSFLDTARTVPAIDRIARLVMLLAVLVVPAAFVLPPQYWRKAMSIVVTGSSVTALAAGLGAFRRGYRPARYFIAARGFRILGIFSYLVAGGNPFINRLAIFFGLQIGSGCEVILLSFALADRITLIRREKEKEMQERSRLEHEILHISDQERRRISHDLHDGLCQQLSSALVRCSLLEEKLTDDKRYRGELAQLSSLLEESVDHAYDLSRGLWPVEQDSYGLGHSLEELTRRQAASSGIAIGFRRELSCEECVCGGAAQLYRIAQEAIANAVKHSGAGRIDVALICRDHEGFTLTVRDNGAGRTPGSTTKGGMGTGIMAYRANAAGGSLNIGDAEGGGTHVTCIIPCDFGSTERDSHAGHP